MGVFGFMILLLEFTGMVMGGGGSHSCGFPAVYNFGDSNSDTGAISAAFSEVPPPNGETFFGHPSGRSCDGRLIVDFIAEALKLPYLSPYLDSIGTNFRHGANFATGGSSILRGGGYSPFDLGVQISQFRRFKSHTTALYNNRKRSSSKTKTKSNLPVPGDFSKALYTFDIGQNDLSHGFQFSTVQQTRASIPNILANFSGAVQQLYKEGARFFWVHNTGPVGCLPYSVIYSGNATNLDQSGCVRPLNEVAQEFNTQLKNTVLKLRSNLPLSAFTYTDLYSAKYSLIGNAKNQGFVDPMSFCCGSYYGYHINCGQRAVVNGTVYGDPCSRPSERISWDGIHYSEAANLWVASRVLNGSFSDPPVSVQEACQNQKTL